MTLVDQLIREQGDVLVTKISAKLQIPREEAEKILPLAASAVMDRLHPNRELEDDVSKTRASEQSTLDKILDETSEQVGADVRSRYGLPPEKAAVLVPLILPSVLRFLVRRVPYGGPLLALVSNVVQQQGYGSLDEIAVRLIGRLTAPPSEPHGPRPSLATRLGRFAGKYFPSSDD